MSYQNFKDNLLEGKIPAAMFALAINVVALAGVREINDVCFLVFVFSLPMVAFACFFHLQKWAKEKSKSRLLFTIEKVLLVAFLGMQIFNFLEKLEVVQGVHFIEACLIGVLFSLGLWWCERYFKEIIVPESKKEETTA